MVFGSVQENNLNTSRYDRDLLYCFKDRPPSDNIRIQRLQNGGRSNNLKWENVVNEDTKEIFAKVERGW